MKRPTLEAATIDLAHTYAAANGYAPDDRTAAGLILAGIVLSAVCSEAVRAAIREEYLKAHPEARGTMERWAQYLERRLP